MKVTWVAALPAAVAIAACAAASRDASIRGLTVRAPNLDSPRTEVYPAAARPEDPVKLGVWEKINVDRAAAGLPAVAWDEAASKVSDDFCAEQVRESTNGHYLTDGVPPYARTGLAGIFGMGAENAVSWRTTGPKFRESALGLALAGHADMLRETPPSDGHRRTILDPNVTHVGVGWAEGHGSFRMTEEFLTRHLSQLTLERVADVPSPILVRGRMRPPHRLDFVTIAHEPSPRRISKSEANSRTTYSYPEPQLAYVPKGNKSLRVVGVDTEDRLQVGQGGDFSFRLTPAMPGLWTIVFYSAEGREKPRPGGSAVLMIEEKRIAP